MPGGSVSVSKARSRLAVQSKRHKRLGTSETHATVEAARRELAAAKLESYIAAVVAAAPPLTDEQRSRLMRLLRTSA